MQGFTKLVFDDKEGALHEKPCKQALHAIRHLGLLFKKLQIPCTSKRCQTALYKYVETDRELGDYSIDEDLLNRFCRVADHLVDSVLIGFDTEFLVPKHGPGSTADALRGNQKFDSSQLTWITEWDQYLFDGLTFAANEDCFHSDPASLKTRNLEQSTVKVITVPKTQKTPRIIAMEPTAMQAVQQSIKDFLVKRLESHPLTRGHVNFTDQSINRRLALKSSIDRKYATVDLSEASDRIPYKMVDHMFRINSSLQDMIFLSRSQAASVDVGDSTVFISKLNKYASMGSATCFPVESLYFYIVCIVALLEARRLPPTHTNIFKVSREIYVYGDDIIFPMNEIEVLLLYMPKFACKVNTSKTFYKGRFRESCGIDAYDGCNITPIYCRAIPRTKRDSSAIVSFTSFCNLLYSEGYRSVPYKLMSFVESIVGCLPTVEETCGGLGWLFPTGNDVPRRINPSYQRLEFKTLVPHVPMVKDHIEGYGALWKCLLGSSFRKPEDQLPNVDHLDKSQRRGTLTLKRRWVSPL
jgi:hypothetical protein